MATPEQVRRKHTHTHKTPHLFNFLSALNDRFSLQKKNSFSPHSLLGCRENITPDLDAAQKETDDPLRFQILTYTRIQQRDR